MRQFLMTQRLFKFIKIKQKNRFAVIINASNDITSKQIVTIIILVIAVENKLIKWKLEHELIINVIQNRLDNNLLSDYENEINVYIL